MAIKSIKGEVMAIDKPDNKPEDTLPRTRDESDRVVSHTISSGLIMWKRLQGHVRDKERQIGAPVLLETTYDEDQLRHIPNVSQAQIASHQPYAPQAYDHLSPQHSYDNRASEIPTVSSIYSQPSPEFSYHHNPSASPRANFEVSPPSSPEIDQFEQENPGQPRRFRSMRDVSPVDQNRGQSTPSPRGASNIPVLRKAPPNLRKEGSAATTQKFWGGKVAPNSKVLWDEYSGEPTSSNAGKTSQVSPGSFVAPSPPSSERQPMGYEVSVTGPGTNAKKDTSLAERANRFGTKPSPVDTRPREPWSLAVGRAEIVKPFKDRPSEKPILTYVRKPDPTRASRSTNPASSSPATTSKRAPVRADTESVANTPDEFDMHEEPVKPTVPLKVGRNSTPRSLASPTSPHNPGNLADAYPSPSTPTNKQTPAAPSNESGVAKSNSGQPESSTQVTTLARTSSEDTSGYTLGKDNGPVSRFSWTTYNSATTYQQSPPPSPPPPLPTSRVPLDSASAASSILNRKRPVPVSDKIPSRKPIAESTASIVSTRKTMTSGPPSPRPDSTFSTSTRKALPRPPTELAAADHIEILESQMEDLKVRRNNVYRLLKDLNDMAPPNPMVTDFKRMRLVDQRKKDFENELAEIKREEHDIGLKLHRAWRKREATDGGGNESALWIRRVTR